MTEKPILVVAAMPEEVSLLCRRHALARAPIRSKCWRGRLRDRSVVVAAAGVGPRRAAEGLAGLLEVVVPEAIIFVGTAGALSVSLGVRDLLVAERCVMAGAPGSGVPIPGSAWLDRARLVPGALVGTLVSGSRVLGTAAAKLDLARRHADDRQLMAVDMESHAWASVASRARLPFVVLRAVSDTADEDLPIDLNRALRADGSISRARVAAAALGRPSSWQRLRQLRDRVKSCSRVLERAVVSIIG